MDYSKTVHLPKTSFSMKADLPKREPLLLEFWQKNKIYEKMVNKRMGKQKFILHDGPPYANGRIHMGHALNKILKDMIVKYKSLTNFYSPYVPGWDCHGLPIEHQLMKKLGKNKHTVDRVEFRKKAADFALDFVEIQKEEFKRLAIFGDWGKPYLTLTPPYEGVILKTFRELLAKDFIYRDKKPVLWCAACETALAEAEVEYEEKESPAIYVKFRVNLHCPDSKFSNIPINSFYIVIWTTTPWTLPANIGLMLHPKLEYEVVHIKTRGEYWLLAKNLLQNILENKLKLNSEDYEVVGCFSGEYFKAWNYNRIFPEVGNERVSKVILSEEVSSEEGTGIVHIAPGHGDVDYIQGHRLNHLPILSPVDDSGKFSEEVNHPELKGCFVLKEGNQKILEILGQSGNNSLVFQETIRHSYPHCWRCKKPVIFRATYQWFLSVKKEDLRGKMLKEIENVTWIPAYGKNRIRGMVEQRPDWCLSRQRLWGTPIPILYCKQCKNPLLEDQAIGMIEEVIGLEGSDSWFKEGANHFLQTEFECEKCKGKEFMQEHDILDVWFDSGVSHEAVLKGEETTFNGKSWKEELSWPADLYLEGSDQHRGWFQTSLIPSVALHGTAPYKAVLTHGFIVDGQGKKMSKSMGNVIAPEDILKDYGADILRLWVASSDYREDIRLSKDILKGVAENYRKIRNSFRYMLGNLAEFNVEKELLPESQLLEIDRWALMRLALAIETSKKAYESYEFHRVVVSLVEFCAVDGSSFYFDVLKDRLYTYGKNSIERKSAQTALYQILSSLLPLFSPILSFTCEEVWQVGLQEKLWFEETVFLTSFPENHSQWLNKELNAKWAVILKVREQANLSLEAARREGLIGSSLESKLNFSGGNELEKQILREMEKELPMIFIVSQVELDGLNGDLKIFVKKADGLKCKRCWRYDISVKEEGNFPELCNRCHEAIK
ncbi:MAG: isoleucine--tRNA ligase [Elusimicrobia bacterium]|nr:isoleucine--tRNA ligase [Elusimicrobiota bacterium]